MAAGRLGLLGFSLAMMTLGLADCSSGDAALSTASVAADAPSISNRDLARTEWFVETHAVHGAGPPPDRTVALTLKSAINRAFAYNPSLKAAFIEIEAKHGEAAQAAVKPNPERALDIEDFGGSKDKAGFRIVQETKQKYRSRHS
jgi:cobalt-zinc-cadmium efflux system outer membrane protein